MESHPWLNEKAVRRVRQILKSFSHWTGRDLWEEKGSDQERAKAIFEAPFILVAHGTQTDPLLDYGNRLAFQLWETKWEDFIGMPSRLTAETPEREGRDQLLAEVAAKGYSDKYGGIRATQSGRRFKIEEAIVWNVLDEWGRYAGQAATFEKWIYLSK